jgi:hypothetical protein
MNSLPHMHRCSLSIWSSNAAYRSFRYYLSHRPQELGPLDLQSQSSHHRYNVRELELGIVLAGAGLGATEHRQVFVPGAPVQGPCEMEVKVRIIVGVRILGIILLLGLAVLTGAQASAQDDGGACEPLRMGMSTPAMAEELGTPTNGETEEANATVVDMDETRDLATPSGELEVHAASTPIGEDEAVAVGTPAASMADVLGDDGVLDVSDEGFLCQDIDDDGVFDIGIDEDGDGVLDENEVLGSDLNDDEALTEDELGAHSADDEGESPATWGRNDPGDPVLNVEDEGFLREDIDDDGVFEIGVDEDQSGTLDEDEVLGTDLNNDEALSEDELDN